MDDKHDRIVREYMEKVLALRRERQQEELSNEELERIALESGLGKEDVEYARKSLNDHLSRGKGFLQYGNWPRAADELEQAAALSPNSVSVLVDAATALWNHGVTEGENADKVRAMQYAERALQLDAGNTKAIRLVTHMTEHPKELFNVGTQSSSPKHTFTNEQALMAGIAADIVEENKHKRRTAIITLVVTFTIIILGGFIPFICASNDSGSDYSPPVSTSSELPANTATASASTTDDVPGFAQLVFVFGSEGIGPGRLNDARHIGTDAAGNIYVGEYSGGRIQVFDAAGIFLTQWNMGDDFPMRGMAVGRDGTVFIVFRGAIHKYEGKTGKPLGTIKYKGGNGFDDVVMAPDGGLAAVWDRMSDDIVIFDRDGKVKRVIEKGVSEASGETVMGIRIAMDGSENLYALDEQGRAVFKFDKNGRFINRFGGDGDQPGQFRAPDAIAVDGRGRIYVSDFKGVQVFDADGRYVGMFDVDGAASGITLNDQGEVLVVARDQVFRYRVE